jgi:uncharacterized protein YbbK (DUF523 family)
MKLVSACLVGVNCRYDGKNNLNRKVIEICKKEGMVPVCPEILGGLSIPRGHFEIRNGSGLDVLNGKARVFEKNEKDVTEMFLKGAKETLKIARILKVKGAIMKSKSPSCGCGKIYDGTFSGRLIEGDGVTTALLKREEIKVITEDDL